MPDVTVVARVFVRAVADGDADWVHDILTMDCAAEVAVEVARMYCRLEESYEKAGAANRDLVLARAELRARVAELRSDLDARCAQAPKRRK